MPEHLERSDLVYAARRVADHAVDVGILAMPLPPRSVSNHLGAVLADSVLQAGLNYANVVRPRIVFIVQNFPGAATLGPLIAVIEREGISAFLQWQHREKISRFEHLVDFICKEGIESTCDLRCALQEKSFKMHIQQVRGVGPKTVDYMACLVGADNIAVDRHIRGFSQIVGLEDSSYDYLSKVFGFAADLLCVPRREFDARIWHFQSEGAER
jgi:hypothetical protein